VIRTSRKIGPIKLKATGAGLSDASLIISANAAQPQAELH